ncbi:MULTISPECIES: isocitrate lyase/PEP mutase family protein [Actinoplanes]|uniref:isocitrate lyase/PEP mutase family protein n=1 Tax=Actinoplanes TaxID=1865 RepID=UPI0005F2FE22|nr:MULTISPECIES: isocitrate lyase/PEP mutase family protein [Actinoplanes]GLX99832.1 carboxyvinyl-carboxyphosphonate phosphorylmutase [Actinoplanes sp. NBRC 101535]
MTASALRALLSSEKVTHVPGVWDPVTAALAARAGHPAVHLSTTAVSAVLLGRPDLDFVGATQVADRASTLVAALEGVPLLADADAGYDSPSHAVWTGQAYLRAGISGLHLTDRSTGDRREIFGLAPATATIRSLAEQVPDLALLARTDAYATEGLPGVVRRTRAYAEAGADAVLPEGVTDPDELMAIHRAAPGVPLVIERSEAAPRRIPQLYASPKVTGTDPETTDAVLAAAGVRLVLHPLAALLAAVRGASLAYRALAEAGSAEETDRMPWAALTALAERPETREPDSRHVPRGLHT